MSIADAGVQFEKVIVVTLTAESTDAPSNIAPANAGPVVLFSVPLQSPSTALVATVLFAESVSVAPLAVLELNAAFKGKESDEATGAVVAGGGAELPPPPPPPQAISTKELITTAR